MEPNTGLEVSAIFRSLFQELFQAKLFSAFFYRYKFLICLYIKKNLENSLAWKSFWNIERNIADTPKPVLSIWFIQPSSYFYHIYNRLFGLVGRVFTNGPGYLVSLPDHVIL